MSKFQVVVFNTITEGFTPEDDERNLSKYLKNDSEKTSKLLNREKTILKKGISSSDIDKYERVLDKCGISYEIEPIQNVPSSQAPLSMEEQNSEEKNEIKSDKNISEHLKPNKLYSLTQIALGTYLGGPLAAIYFLKGNFDVLGKEGMSKKTLQIGLAVSLILIIILPFLPEATPNTIIPMLYLIPVIMIVKKHQISKDVIIGSDEYDFQSSWKVFGMSIAWMIAFLLITILFMGILESAGIIILT
jgi:hypothetical protein